jgi:outer membrane lipoprotein-sorting protein
MKKSVLTINNSPRSLDSGRLAAAVLLLSVLFCPGRYASAADEVSAGSLFLGVEQRFLNVDTLSYTVKKVSTLKSKQNEEEWLFRYKKPRQVRIDYQVPHERLIVLDEQALVEYIPLLKKAVRTDLASKSKNKADQTIADVMSHVSVDGLRVGNYEELEKKAVSVRKVTWAGADAYLIEGTDPRYVMYIDKAKNVLLRSEIYDKKGVLVIRTEASRFTETAKDFWMPREIHITYNTPEGFVQSKILLQDIKVDEMIPEDVFHFSVPKGTVIKNY